MGCEAAAVTVADGGVGRDSTHPFLHVPLPCPTLYSTPAWQLECIDLTGEVTVDVTGHGLGCLISARHEQWCGKMMFITTTHDIMAQRYHHADCVTISLYWEVHNDIVGRDHTIQALISLAPYMAWRARLNACVYSHARLDQRKSIYIAANSRLAAASRCTTAKCKCSVLKISFSPQRWPPST